MSNALSAQWKGCPSGLLSENCLLHLILQTPVMHALPTKVVFKQWAQINDFSDSIALCITHINTHNQTCICTGDWVPHQFKCLVLFCCCPHDFHWQGLDCKDTSCFVPHEQEGDVCCQLLTGPDLHSSSILCCAVKVSTTTAILQIDVHFQCQPSYYPPNQASFAVYWVHSNNFISVLEASVSCTLFIHSAEKLVYHTLSLIILGDVWESYCINRNCSFNFSESPWCIPNFSVKIVAW